MPQLPLSYDDIIDVYNGQKINKMYNIVLCLNFDFDNQYELANMIIKYTIHTFGK